MDKGALRALGMAVGLWSSYEVSRRFVPTAGMVQFLWLAVWENISLCWNQNSTLESSGQFLARVLFNLLKGCGDWADLSRALGWSQGAQDQRSSVATD